MSAPSSGRWSRRTKTLTVARRSSPVPTGRGVGTGLLTTLMVFSPCRWRYRAGRSGPVDHFRLSSALSGQARDRGGVALVDDARAALDDVESADGVRVLLVDREVELFSLDVFNHAGADVKGRDLGL